MSLKEIKSLVTTMLNNIDQELEDTAFLKKIQEKTGLKPSIICLSIVVLISTLAIF